VPTAPLAWGARVSPRFRERVYEICRRFGWTDEQASDLMACMAFESARTFSPSIRNAAGSGAVGLIQFMPFTAHQMGITTLRLAGMTAEAQLDYVEQYFEPYHTRIRTLPDMYMAILLPKFVGAGDDAVLFSEGVSYRQNSGLDTNNDHEVTKGEAASRVAEQRRVGLMPGNCFPDFSNVVAGASTTAPRA
jgi:hypothetical protein